MNQNTVSLKKFIDGILIIAVFVMVVVLSRSGLFRNTVYSSSLGEANQKTGSIDNVNVAVQYFVPTHQHLATISLMFDTTEMSSADGTIVLWMYDADDNFVTSVETAIQDIQSGAYYGFDVNVDVTAGNTYGYTVLCNGLTDSGPSVIYRSTQTAGPIENTTLTYLDQTVNNGSLTVRYVYATPLRVSQVVTYLLFAILILITLIQLIHKLLPQKAAASLVRLDLVFRVMMTIVITGGMAAGFYLTLYKRYFGGQLLDQIFYGIGIALFGVYSLLSVWKMNLSAVFSLKRENIGQYINTVVQILSLGFYIVMYVYYYNSGLNYGHYLGISYMNAALAVFMFTLFDAKEIFSPISGIYSLLYWGLCGSWMFTHTYDAETYALYMVAIFVGWFWGIVLIRTIIRIFKRKIRRLTLLYGLILAAFFVCMLIFKNTRVWPYLIVLFFSCFYIQKIDEFRMGMILNNFCRAVMLSYVYLIIKSLLYRPFHRYVYYRYPGPFAGVAVWGVYLALVYAVLFAKIMIEAKKDASLRHMCLYYLIMGSCLGYIFLSVSRTAITAVILVTIAGVILLIATIYRHHLRRMFRIILSAVIVTVALFPGIYTLTRTVPAIIRDPHINLYEENAEISIYAEDTPDSPKYINVKAMLESSMTKLMLTFSGDSGISQNELDESINSNKPTNLAVNDKSNGRGEIFMAYMKTLNLTGHDVMYLEAENETYAHAHNTFIQSAYDFGIITGLIFLLVGVTAFIRSILYMKNKSDKHLFTFVPFVVIIAFGVCGMTEWIFHPSIPITLALMLVQAPLLSPLKKELSNEKMGTEL